MSHNLPDHIHTLVLDLDEDYMEKLAPCLPLLLPKVFGRIVICQAHFSEQETFEAIFEHSYNAEELCECLLQSFIFVAA